MSKRNEAVYALRAPIRNLEKRAEDAEAEVERLSAKLARLEGLERAAREYRKSQSFWNPDGFWRPLAEAARAYASENGE